MPPARINFFQKKDDKLMFFLTGLSEQKKSIYPWSTLIWGEGGEIKSVRSFYP